MSLQKKPPEEGDKGNRVLFSTGPYKYKLGWLNVNKRQTTKKQYVILEKTDKSLFGTQVNVETICIYDRSKPTCLVEAAMKRAKFLSMMNQFAWIAAKYNIDIGEDCMLFVKLAALIEEKKTLLRAMGEDADWKIFTFVHPVTKERHTNFDFDD